DFHVTGVQTCALPILSTCPNPPKNDSQATLVKTPASTPSCHLPDMTIVMPVMVQMTSVSKKTCVMETSAWRPGMSDFAAAAAIGAEPRPASFEKRPLAIP